MSPRPSTLVEVARAHAATLPEQVAIRFLEDGEDRETVVTYSELDRQARRIAAALLQIGAPGERALLLYEPGIDYIFAYVGCLFAGWAPVPAHPPHRAHLPRVRAISQDARPLVALTTGAIAPLAGPLLAEARRHGETGSANLRVIATDQLPVGSEEYWREPAIDGDTIALIQYTSGSVDTPNGVIVSHSNLLHNLSLIGRCDAAPPVGRVVSWLPPYHDMGLIGGILYPISIGHQAVLMSPFHFLMRPS